MSSRRLLLVPLCLVAVAHEGLAAEPANLPLKPDSQLMPAGGKGAARNQPIHFEADRMEGVPDRDFIAEGRVSLRQGDQLVEADWLRYERQEDQLEARGNVRFSEPERGLSGQNLKLRITEHLGEMQGVRYKFMTREGLTAQGSAGVIKFLGKDRYNLRESTYTTCPADRQDWVLRSEELQLDYVASVGNARRVKVEYLDTPILYAPWMDFALDDKRKSGFLSPAYGVSDLRGVELIVPWYWNIAPHQDATITPRLMLRRGLQLGGEYRYLQPDYQGDVLLEVLPNDQVKNETRARGVIHHSHRFSPRLSGRLNLEGVSDDTYFTDLSSQASDTSRVNLAREASLTYAGDGWNVTGRLQSYQTLQDSQDPLSPYQRLPQIVFNGRRPDTLVPGLDLEINGEYVNYRHDTDQLVLGSRFHLNPTISQTWQNSFASLTPKLGWYLTRYDLDKGTLSNTADSVCKVGSNCPTTFASQTRSLPMFSLDSQLLLERDWSWRGRGFVQTLEPRAYFVYIPKRRQTDIPVFDSGLADLSLSQLFTENQFTSVDRINNAKQLTVAVTSRFLEPASGVERLQVTVGQRYYFADQEVTLLANDPVRGGDSTDLLAQFAGQINRRVRVLGGIQFNTDDGDTVKANLGYAYRDGLGKIFNADYRFTNDRYAAGVDQLDFSWQWPLKPKWYGLGRINYSFQESRLVEGLLGFEYNPGCWSLRGVVQRLATSEDDASNAFFLQLELRGLTKLGPNPLEILKRSISGYAKSDVIDLP
jgi:LPS-assembly protein